MATQAPHEQNGVACLGQIEYPGTPGLLQALGHLLQINISGKAN